MVSMAVSQADLSRLDAILKDRPLVDALQEAINKATPLAEKFTNTLTLSGRKGIVPVSFGVNEGVYARADKGSFGDSVVDQPLLANVTAKFLYAIFEISGPTMSATRDSVGSFEDALALELENTTDGFKLQFARMILNKANGLVATVASRTDADTAVIINPFGLTYKQNRPVRNILRKGTNIDIMTTGGTAHVTNSALTGITHASTGTTVDYSPAEVATVAAADEVYVSGNKALEPDGFFAGVQTTGTYLGIARAGNEGWQGVVTDAAGGGSATVALDPDVLRDSMDSIMEVSGQTPDLIVCNYKQRRNVYNLYAPQIRYAPMILPAGLTESTLQFDGLPVIAERFFPPEHIGFVNTRFWYHAIDKDVEWIQGLQGTVLHFTLSSDVFRAVLRTYRNICTLYPAASGYVYGLDE
jgi:hypothetical protein